MIGALEKGKNLHLDDAYANKGKSMKYILIILFLIILSFVLYKIGYRNGHKAGYKNGYGRGKVDLALDITNELNETVNSNTINQNYSHFQDIKDITLYTYTKGGTKTISIWKE